MEISFVIPIYNEKENVEILIKKLEEAVEDKFTDYEFILVDDGSTDNTREIIENYKRDISKRSQFTGNCHSAGTLLPAFTLFTLA